MAWNEETLMEQKHRFVSLAATGRFTFTELCADFHVSRKTGHKWWKREVDPGNWTGRIVNRNSKKTIHIGQRRSHFRGDGNYTSLFVAVRFEGSRGVKIPPVCSEKRSKRIGVERGCGERRGVPCLSPPLRLILTFLGRTLGIAGKLKDSGVMD